MNLPFYPARPKQGGRNFLAAHDSLYSKGKWLFTPKFNGWRAILHAESGTMWNRHGSQLSIASEFTEAIQQIREARAKAIANTFDERDHIGWNWYDVEALDRRHSRGRGALVVLDMPMLNLPFDNRRIEFGAMFPTSADCHCSVPDRAYSCPAYESLDIWQHMQEVNKELGITFYEGVVAKRRASQYPLQRRSPSEETADWIKHRFTTK